MRRQSYVACMCEFSPFFQTRAHEPTKIRKYLHEETTGGNCLYREMQKIRILFSTCGEKDHATNRADFSRVKNALPYLPRGHNMAPITQSTLRLLEIYKTISYE